MLDLRSFLDNAVFLDRSLTSGLFTRWGKLLCGL
jgi:hypothetical protein